MNCSGCWNYKHCKNKNNSELYYCFRKNESVCHYCTKEDTCKKACNTMVMCTEFERKVNKEC